MNKARDHIISYTLIMPAIVAMSVFVFWPIVYSLILSGQQYRLGFRSHAYVGLQNYVALLRSDTFWNALLNTATYSVAVVGASLFSGLLLAAAVVNTGRYSVVWRATFFLPVAATMAAMAIVWRFILDDNYGILNSLLVALGWSSIDFLGRPEYAMGSVVFISVWSNAGYAMVFFYAGLISIPQSLYESAAIDGASRSFVFRFVTWPLLSPTTLFLAIIMTKRALSAFDTIKVMTDGGPVRATEVLSLLLFEEAFEHFNVGYASALAMAFFVIVLCLALLQMRLERMVFYQ